MRINLCTGKLATCPPCRTYFCSKKTTFRRASRGILWLQFLESPGTSGISVAQVSEELGGLASKLRGQSSGRYHHHLTYNISMPLYHHNPLYIISGKLHISCRLCSWHQQHQTTEWCLQPSHWWWVYTWRRCSWRCDRRTSQCLPQASGFHPLYGSVRPIAQWWRPPRWGENRSWTKWTCSLAANRKHCWTAMVSVLIL